MNPVEPAPTPVRVVLCTTEGIIGASVLRSLVSSPDIAVTGVILSSRVLSPRYGWSRGAWQQIRTSGLRYALYLWCATGLSDLIGRCGPAGAVSSIASAQRIPILTTRDLNAQPGRDFIAARAPEVLLSAFFNQRIAPETYAIAPNGGINIHPSLLPDFRGVDPVFYTRLRGTARFGVSVHRIDADLDTGEILAQSEHVPGPADSVLRTTLDLYVSGSYLVTQRLRAFLRAERGRSQRDSGSYYSWPSAADVAALHEAGGCLIRWQDLMASLTGRPGQPATG